jgi:CO dehydrogenase maturation factor
VSVYRQWTDYAADHDVALAVIGNKVHDAQDVAFLRDHVGDAHSRTPAPGPTRQLART